MRTGTVSCRGGGRGRVTGHLTPPGKELRVRADTFGYLRRSLPGCVSQRDGEEARYVGRMAVYYSSGEQNTEGSGAMRRGASEEYKIDTFLTPLATVAR